MRDFTVTASPSFTVHSARVGSTTVSVYAKVGYPVSTVLGYAKSAIAGEGALVGAYPYPTFSVVQSAGEDGMETSQGCNCQAATSESIAAGHAWASS